MSALDVAKRYYAALDRQADLASVPMADDLVFKSPMMTLESAEAFRQALGGLMERAQGLKIRHQTLQGDAVLSVYDFDLGANGGPIPMAEVVHVAGERIREIELIFDPARMA